MGLLCYRAAEWNARAARLLPAQPVKEKAAQSSSILFYLPYLRLQTLDITLH